MNTRRNPAKVVDILIADDHQMVRDGLKVMLFTKKASMEVNIREAETAEEAIEKSLQHTFDIILMDYDLPDQGGVTATREILGAQPATKILALSHNDEFAYIEQMIAAGARGYILKNIGASQLLNAIKTILDGSPYFSNEAAVQLLEARKRTHLKGPKRSIITKREREVLQFIAGGMTNREIGTKLFISARTVETHRQHIAAKLNVKNSAEVVKAAYLQGII